MVKEDIVEKEVVAAIEDHKFLIADKILKIKQFNIQDKTVKNCLICQIISPHCKIHQ